MAARRAAFASGILGRSANSVAMARSFLFAGIGK
jgi:hypothetical protein